MSNHGPSYGLDADIAQKQAGKLDPKLEAEAKQYISEWTGTPVNDLAQDLHTGVLLCNFINKIGTAYTHAYGGPPVRQISSMNMPFKHMENIGNFLVGCEKLGLRKVDCFMTVDLYEAKNLVAVVDTVLALKRKFPYKKA